MGIVVIVLLVALLIPVLAILLESPMGRALGRRLEGEQGPEPELRQLARKVELLEAEVDDLGRGLQDVRDENAFLQRLLEEGGERRALPPPDTP
jgi:hypothetical protein